MACLFVHDYIRKVRKHDIVQAACPQIYSSSAVLDRHETGEKIKGQGHTDKTRMVK